MLQETSLCLCWLGESESNKSSSLSWYKINPLESTNGPPEVLEAISDEYPDSYCGTSGCLGESKIYLFGGHLRPLHRDVMGITQTIPRNEFSDEILFYDTKDFSGESIIRWQTHTSKMLSKRSLPCCVSWKSKSYIFGSEYDYNSPNRVPTPWAEVFHTKKGSLKPLPGPPQQLILHNRGVFASAVMADHTKILLAASASSSHNAYKPSQDQKVMLFTYDIIHNQWETGNHLLLNPPPSLMFPIVSPRSAVLDGVLYTFAFGRVHAYSFTQNKWLEVSDLFPNIEIHHEFGLPFGFIGHLKENFLFAVFATHDSNDFHVHYASFEPLPDFTTGSIGFHIISSGTYLISDHQKHSLIDAVAL